MGVDQVFDLFDRLGATDKQLDFPIIYTSALLGYATTDPANTTNDMSVYLQAIVDHVPPPSVDPEGVSNAKSPRWIF